MDVISRIKQLRDDKGYSTNKLAVKAGLTQSTLQSVLSGRNLPSIITLEKICNALDITLSDFFAPADNSEPFSNDLKELLQSAKGLTPEQIKAFTETFKTITKG